MAGSWVYGSLATWMGDAAKNRAWDLLCEAKAAFDRVGPDAAASAAARRRGPRSWRCARAPTGSGGSATTTRPRR